LSVHLGDRGDAASGFASVNVLLGDFHFVIGRSCILIIGDLHTRHIIHRRTLSLVSLDLQTISLQVALHRLDLVAQVLHTVQPASSLLEALLFLLRQQLLQLLVGVAQHRLQNRPLLLKRKLFRQ